MKRLLLALLLLPSLVFAQFPTISVLDTFDGTADPLGGIWTDNAIGSEGCAKVGGLATRAGGTNLASCYVTETFGADQEVYATLRNPTTWANGTGVYLIGCLQPESVGTATADGYTFRATSRTGADNDDIRFYRYDDSALFAIGPAFNQELADGDSWGMQILADGTLLGYYKPVGGSWSLVVTTTDTTYDCTDTHVGLNIRHSSQALDDFGGGDLIAEEPPPPATFPIHGVLDTFDVDQNPAGGIWINGATVVGGSGCQTTGGVLTTPAAVVEDCYINTSLSPPMEAYATLPNQTSASVDEGWYPMLFCLRSMGTTEADGYGIRLTKRDASDEVRVERFDNGAITTLGAAILQELVSGNKVGAERLNDGTINVYADTGLGFALIGARVDTTYTCEDSYLGARFHNTTHMVDDYGGGGMVAAPTQPHFMIMEFQ